MSLSNTNFKVQSQFYLILYFIYKFDKAEKAGIELIIDWWFKNEGACTPVRLDEDLTH